MDARRNPSGMTESSVDPDQIAHFAALSGQWWDPRGPLRMLHQLNPTRIGFIRDHLVDRFDRDPAAARPLSGLTVLDVGCGGGLLAEPLARLGATVTAIDAAADSIAVARTHAEALGLTIDYRCATVADVAGGSDRYDAVLAMEIVEHVADLGAFMAALCASVGSNGSLVMATLNRTLKSYAMAIVGAEYILNWVPRGSHTWSRFVRPAELIRACAQHGLQTDHVTGVVYSPLRNCWRLSRDLDVNYMLIARRSDSANAASARRSYSDIEL